MSTHYYWYLVDSRTDTTAASKKSYSSIEKARESAERYVINKWPHSDPEDIIVSIYRSDGRCVYYDFVVPDVDMEGLNTTERFRFARMIMKIKPIASMKDV